MFKKRCNVMYSVFPTDKKGHTTCTDKTFEA